MIRVTYMPSGEAGPFENSATEKDFETFNEFKDFVKNYVCEHCLVDFKDWEDRETLTIADYLSMGCGAEIFVEDEENMIDWEYKVND